MPRSQTILITGATSGIGRHAALYLARTGHRVFATGRRKDALAALEAEASGSDLAALRLDVTDDNSIAAACADIERRTGGYGVDVVINNAGYGLPGPLTEIPDDDLRAQFDTNVFGLMAVTRAFVGNMRERGHGRIINVSSIAGRVTVPFFGAYHASKHAVEALSDALRAELYPFGIRVVLIEPGPIDTGFADQSINLVNKYRDSASPYAAIYERADAIRARSDAMAVGPEPITRAIEHAIRARRPRIRYMAPLRFRFLIPLLRMAPTRLVDWAMRRTLGLSPKTVRRPSAPAKKTPPPPEPRSRARA